MKFTPRDNWVLLRVLDKDQTNRKTILLPGGSSAIGGVVGEVIQKGRGAVYEDGKRSEHCLDDLEVGAKVLVMVTGKISDLPFIGDRKDRLWLVQAEEIACIVDMDSSYEWNEEPQTPVVLEA